MRIVFAIIFVAALLFSENYASPNPPQRIISGMPSITEMLFALNLGSRIVGVTTNCNYPPEAQKKEKVGGFFLNLEKIVSLKPDLVIMLEDAQKRDIEKFKRYGLPVFTVNPHNVSEVMESLIKIGEVTRARSEAERLVSRMKRKINSYRLTDLLGGRKTVLVAVGCRPLIGVGNNNFINDIIQLAGGKNVLENSKSPYPEINLEELYQLNPQNIIVLKDLMPEIENDKRWQKIKAVKEGKILFIDNDIISRPAPRLVEAIDQIAGFLRK